MALLDIIVAPDQRLKIPAEAVDGVDDDVRRLMDAMLETMHSANGLGLAAPQVGDSRRVIIVAVAGVYSWLLTIAGAAQFAAEFIGGLDVEPWVVLLIINIFLLLGWNVC